MTRTRSLTPLSYLRQALAPEATTVVMMVEMTAVTTAEATMAVIMAATMAVQRTSTNSAAAAVTRAARPARLGQPAMRLMTGTLSVYSL